ncbi:MAG: TetR/AcrR family transcriptional regulator [Dehalococcoidia bacterium]|nr:TetR/AcrR family transcriptional regulator [Dehalococcoidia bacterium]
MIKGNRRRSRKEKRRQEILRISSRIFREKTYDGTTLKDIADAVGMLKGSLYYYISSKQELFSDIIVEAVKVLDRSVEDVYQANLQPLDRLRAIIHAHVKFSVDYQDTAILFLTGRHIISSMRMVELTRLFERRDKLLIDTLNEGVRSGVFRPMDVRMVALAIVGMCNSVAFWYSPSGPASTNDIAEVFFSIVHEGLAVRG